jgi:hypothetical protein
MSHLIRLLLALQISIVFVAGCAVDEDGIDDTDLAADTDVAAPVDDEAAATSDVPEVAQSRAASADAVSAQALCSSIRLDSRATVSTCRNACANRRQTALGFDNRTKICRCCSPGPL